MPAWGVQYIYIFLFYFSPLVAVLFSSLVCPRGECCSFLFLCFVSSPSRCARCLLAVASAIVFFFFFFSPNDLRPRDKFS